MRLGKLLTITAIAAVIIAYIPTYLLISPVVASSPPPSVPINPVASGDINTSLNWSGYVSTGGTFTYVTGTWTIPQNKNSSIVPNGDATWVGIGGVQGRDLIQAGTQSITDSTGQPNFQAWYELLPQYSQQIPITVNPGDSVTVTIGQQSSILWNISFADNTNSQKYQTTVRYSSSLSSAEWIQEMLSVNRGLLPLDNFGNVNFTAGYAVKNGVKQSIAQSGAQAVTMVDSLGQILAEPSSLGSNGVSFAVNRTATAPDVFSIVPFRYRFRLRFSFDTEIPSEYI